jgi:diguanylate cyclase (GGDEF)-like protein
MIVDDNPLNIKVLATILDEYSELLICMNGLEALEALKTEVPDLILLDVMMPGMDGFEVAQIIRNDLDMKDLPIIFLTAKADTEDMVKGFNSGGNDYVLKPFNEIELKARVKNQIDLKSSRDQLIQKNKELEGLIQKLEISAITDPLTGLYNRRYMMQKISEEVARFTRYGHSFVMIMADIDYFKLINDQYGHECGDDVLKAVTQTMAIGLRANDVLARWGGEEFLLLLPETTMDGGRLLAERIRQQVEELKVSYNQHTISVTLTLGLSHFSSGLTVDKVIFLADQGLYQGKKSGRNKVVAVADGNEA